jgi:phosphatidylserine/phosphatidylglycerophosphate/cardiolipin synthase-like enzyme
MDSVRSRILVAAYSFRSKRIAGALIRAHRRGVNVKVVLDALQTRTGVSQY